jgi:hypothetical protein
MGRPKELVTAVQFRTDEPQVVHVLAAHGAESGDDAARRALTLRGPSARARTHYGLGKFCPRIVVTLSDVTDQAALADGFINGSAGAPTKSAQCEAIRATRI